MLNRQLSLIPPLLPGAEVVAGPVPRTCKHLRRYRGDAAEQFRLGSVLSARVDDGAKPAAPPLLLAEVWAG